MPSQPQPQDDAVKLNIGEWRPDMAANENPGAILALNCIPELDSYRSFNGLQEFSNALGSMARGSYWLRASNGVVFNFAGDLEKLYHFVGADWMDVSQPATTYSADVWDFTNFQDRVIATDGGSGDLQYYDAGTSATFDDLPGNPPRAKVIGVVRDFVVLGNYVIGAESESGGIAWSGFNNTEIWTPSLATQCGRRRTRGTGGEVKRIISGTEGVIFRENAILRMIYIGAPNVWDFRDITTLHGTPAGRSVVWTKDQAFYYSVEGFHQLDRQTYKLDPIGFGKVDKWFVENAASADVVNMQGSVDRRNGLVYWPFRSTGSSPTFDRILVYNWEARRFAYAEIFVEFIGEFASIGYNLDTIGAILGGNIDSASIPVDSDAYSGGALSILGFNSSHIAGTFDGTALDAQFDTSEFAIDTKKRGAVHGVRPIVETVGGSTIQVAPISRQLTDANPVVGSFVDLNTETGLAPVRINARYHRYRIKVAGGFTHAKRIEIPSFKRRGSR